MYYILCFVYTFYNSENAKQVNKINLKQNEYDYIHYKIYFLNKNGYVFINRLTSNNQKNIKTY